MAVDARATCGRPIERRRSTIRLRQGTPGHLCRRGIQVTRVIDCGRDDMAVLALELPVPVARAEMRLVSTDGNLLRVAITCRIDRRR